MKKKWIYVALILAVTILPALFFSSQFGLLSVVGQTHKKVHIDAWESTGKWDDPDTESRSASITVPANSTINYIYESVNAKIDSFECDCGRVTASVDTPSFSWSAGGRCKYRTFKRSKNRTLNKYVTSKRTYTISGSAGDHWYDDCRHRGEEARVRASLVVDWSPDSDNDGVPDYTDDCPNTYGKKANGCPRKVDSDNDRIYDRNDACPHTYGEAPNGCPKPKPQKPIWKGIIDSIINWFKNIGLWK